MSNQKKPLSEEAKRKRNDRRNLSQKKRNVKKNKAFFDLQEKLPAETLIDSHGKVSTTKMTILKGAIEYIRVMTEFIAANPVAPDAVNMQNAPNAPNAPNSRTRLSLSPTPLWLSKSPEDPGSHSIQDSSLSELQEELMPPPADWVPLERININQEFQPQDSFGNWVTQW